MSVSTAFQELAAPAKYRATDWARDRLMQREIEWKLFKEYSLYFVSIEPEYNTMPWKEPNYIHCYKEKNTELEVRWIWKQTCQGLNPILLFCPTQEPQELVDNVSEKLINSPWIPGKQGLFSKMQPHICTKMKEEKIFYHASCFLEMLYLKIYQYSDTMWFLEIFNSLSSFFFLLGCFEWIDNFLLPCYRLGSMCISSKHICGIQLPQRRD